MRLAEAGWADLVFQGSGETGRPRAPVPWERGHLARSDFTSSQACLPCEHPAGHRFHRLVNVRVVLTITVTSTARFSLSIHDVRSLWHMTA